MAGGCRYKNIKPKDIFYKGFDIIIMPFYRHYFRLQGYKQTKFWALFIFKKNFDTFSDTTKTLVMPSAGCYFTLSNVIL